MSSHFTVVYDACVLYPAPLRDLLMRLALTDLFRARWTDMIHDEWIRSVLSQRPDLQPQDLQRTRALMNAHVRDCLVGLSGGPRARAGGDTEGVGAQLFVAQEENCSDSSDSEGSAGGGVDAEFRAGRYRHSGAHRPQSYAVSGVYSRASIRSFWRLGMRSSAENIDRPRAVRVSVTQDELAVTLEDGRTIAVPLAWYPRLANATAKERDACSFIGDGTGIHWSAVDEDISIDALLQGRSSGESRDSFARWLAGR